MQPKGKRDKYQELMGRLEASGATDISSDDDGDRVRVRATVPTIGRAYYGIVQRNDKWAIKSFSNKMPPPVDEDGRPFNYSYLTPLLDGYELIVNWTPHKDGYTLEQEAQRSAELGYQISLGTWRHGIKTPDGQVVSWGLGSDGPYESLEAFVRTLFAWYTGPALDYMRDLFGDRQAEIKRRAKLIRDFSFG